MAGKQREIYHLDYYEDSGDEPKPGARKQTKTGMGEEGKEKREEGKEMKKGGKGRMMDGH